MRSNFLSVGVFVTISLVLFAGCASTQQRADRAAGRRLNQPYVDSAEYRQSPERPASDVSSYWVGGGTGMPRIVVRLGEQKAYFYRGSTLAGVSAISSGREGYRTPTGVYKVIQKSRDHRSNLYGDYVDDSGTVVQRNVSVRKHQKPSGAEFRGAPMPHFLRFHGGYGLHGGYLPGYPASHGCIRLPKYMAAHFFDNADYGTPVVVEP